MQTTSATSTNVTLNGEIYAVDDGATVSSLLVDMGLDPRQPRGIAVAVGDEVVPRSEWSRVLQEGDHIEVITARQGG